MMDDAEFAAIADGMDSMVEMAKGFRVKMEAAGFSTPIAEEAALEFLRMVVRGVNKQMPSS